MPFELDHVFVCTDRDAPEASHLGALGLTEGPSRTHPGQGTANRCFLFHNAYLELIWVHDQQEARSPLTEKTKLFERWKGRRNEACPFGICLRPASHSDRNDRPFNTWDYLPRYRSTSNPIRVSTSNDRLAEPMLFFIESASRPDSRPGQPPLQHRLGLHQITQLTWTRPGTDAFSPELRAVVDLGCLSVEQGPAHELHICFDNAATGKSASLLPHLPVTIKWKRPSACRIRNPPPTADIRYPSALSWRGCGNLVSICEDQCTTSCR